MGLFYNNETAGRGVSKNEKPKKPFFRFWETLFMKSGMLVGINLMYFIFCIPIVTFGPATAAMTAMMREIYLGRQIFVMHDFWRLFKKNFKQSLFIGLLDVAAIVGLVLAMMYYPVIPDDDKGMKLALALSAAAEVLFLLMNLYIYPQITALDLRLGEIVRNSLILIFLNPVGEVIAMVIFVGYALLALNFTLFVVGLFPFLPAAGLALLDIFCCYPAIQKHLINPYYERTGQHNPELPEELPDDQKLFKDTGGSDAPIEASREKSSAKIKSKGKVIK